MSTSAQRHAADDCLPGRCAWCTETDDAETRAERATDAQEQANWDHSREGR